MSEGCVLHQHPTRQAEPVPKLAELAAASNTGSEVAQAAAATLAQAAKEEIQHAYEEAEKGKREEENKGHHRSKVEEIAVPVPESPAASDLGMDPVTRQEASKAAIDLGEATRAVQEAVASAMDQARKSHPSQAACLPTYEDIMAKQEEAPKAAPGLNLADLVDTKWAAEDAGRAAGAAVAQTSGAFAFTAEQADRAAAAVKEATENAQRAVESALAGSQPSRVQSGLPTQSEVADAKDASEQVAQAAVTAISEAMKELPQGTSDPATRQAAEYAAGNVKQVAASVENAITSAVSDALASTSAPPAVMDGALAAVVIERAEATKAAAEAVRDAAEKIAAVKTVPPEDQPAAAAVANAALVNAEQLLTEAKSVPTGSVAATLTQQQVENTVREAAEAATETIKQGVAGITLDPEAAAAAASIAALPDEVTRKVVAAVAEAQATPKTGETPRLASADV